jgi:ABC-type multidrug transport system permease subunit
VRYVDWLFPGILGMNMMFSCLFGVGYVVVRYRKSGFLKRLHATPLSAFEFLGAQVLSRLSLILFVTAVLYLGIGTIIRFHSAGNMALLLLVAVLSALSMVALGLTIAARFSSEELVGGLLNVLTWPMMLLSGIWFSLEGSPRWVQWIAHVFPLTHTLDAARAVMLDGAGIRQIAPNLLYLALTALAFLAFGAWSFRWRID